MFISVSAVAATLVGWGALAREEMPEPVDLQGGDVRAKLDSILGELPQLAQVETGSSQGQGAAEEAPTELRSVSLPRQQDSSRPKPVSRTQSSR